MGKILMPLTTKSVLVACAALALTACGSTTTSTFIDNTPTFTRDLLAFSTDSAAVRRETVSDAASMANAGGVYTGRAQVAVLGSGATRTFLGDANLTANIAAGTVSGSLTNFSGGTDQNNPVTMAGSLTVTGQSIGGTRPSRFASGVSGTLTGTGTSVILGAGGTLNGDFYNAPTTGLFASGAVNGSTLDGVPGRSAVINVYGTK
jgi:hypothetical protein